MRQTNIRKVTTVPEGYTKEIRDGKTVYVKQTKNEAPPSVKPIRPPVTKDKSAVKSNNALPPKVKPLVKVKPPVDSYNEDIVMLDEPIVPPTTNIPLYEDKRIDRKLQTPINPNIDYYQYPDANAGYSKPINKYFDRATNQEIDITKSLPDGNYLPSYLENSLKLNEGANLGTVKQGNPRVTTNPEETIILPGNLNDRSGTNSSTTIGTTGYKKGGLVSKIKGYALGGTTGYNEFGSINGVVGQNDAYQKKKDEEDDKSKSSNARNVANAAGQVLGGIGSSYYNSQPTTNQGDATRNAGLASVSQMGGIGGAIGGLAALGDKIGKPIKNRSENLDSSGNLTNSGAAQRDAIGGGLLSPSKALIERGKYKGGYTDITGKGYLKSLEDNAKKQIAEVQDANAQSRIDQAIAARNEGNLNPNIENPYNLANASFDENKKLVLANGQQYNSSYKKGGLVGKAMQKYADGGEIKGKGTGKSDSIVAKVEEKSFVVPEENADVAVELRKKVLGKPPKAKANLNQKDGEKVKLSNGEHLFTPEEKEELLEKGVNVDLLAPNSEVKVNNPVQFPKIVGYKDGGGIPDEEYRKLYAKGNKVYANKTYNELITPPNNWKGTKEEWKSAADKAIREGKVKVLKSGKKGGLSDADYAKMYSTDNSKEVIEKVATGKGKITPPKTGYKVPTVEQKAEDEVVVPVVNSVNNTKAIADAKLLNDSAIASGITPNTIGNNNNYPTRKSGILSRIGNVDPTALVGVGQTALGLNMLGNEKRPIDNAKLDPTYNDNVNRAIEDAKYGLTPEQRFAAEQDIQLGLNDAKFVGLNASGGNGVQAFNTNRAAINDAWRNKLGLKQADTEMRMQKQMYADQQVANRAGILASNRRQAFGDAMRAFDQKQQAGSELIGAGLANTIGAYRFNQEQQAREKADLARTAWERSYGKNM